VDVKETAKQADKRYVLYFGRYSLEKGIGTLLQVCRKMPDVQFVFAGSGPLEAQVNSVPNIENRGFTSGDALWKLVSEAAFTVFTSECYENCPFAVMESLQCAAPVIGVNAGGVPELIREGITGELFECGNAGQLENKIRELWNNPEKCRRYSENCGELTFDTLEKYCDRLCELYSA